MKWKSTSCHTFKGIKIISLNFCRAYVIMTVIIKNTVLTHLPCVSILSHWMLVTTLWSWYSHPHIAERILTIRDISYMPSVTHWYMIKVKLKFSSFGLRGLCSGTLYCLCCHFLGEEQEAWHKMPGLGLCGISCGLQNRFFFFSLSLPFFFLSLA